MNTSTVEIVALLFLLVIYIDGFPVSSSLSTRTTRTTRNKSTYAADTVATTSKPTSSVIVMNPLYSSVLAEPDTVKKFTTAADISADTALSATITATTTTTTTSEIKKPSKSYLDDGFVFGLEGSGLDRPRGKVSVVVVDGDALETTNQQRIIVWSTLLGQFCIASYSVLEILQTNYNQDLLLSFMGGDSNFVAPLAIGWTLLQTISLTLSSWTLADLGSGILHWSVDNYCNGRTPIMGGIIAAFQGHHSAPWTICERGFENNVFKLCIPFGVQTVIALKFLFGLDAYSTYFWTIFCFMEILSQEFHKMSHTPKSQAGSIWNTLQNNGFTIDRKSHAQHHIAPFDGNYCIVSGICNKILDESGVFRRMEHIIYKVNGVESNAWKLDPELRNRTLRGAYGLPTATTTD